MKQNIVSILILSFIIMSFKSDEKNITIWLVGDSTMSIKDKTAYPETGWGMPFAAFFDSTISIDNVAQNGRSTKSFIEEGRWKNVMDNLHEGDYVFVQFGHNDEVKEKTDRYTTPAEFSNNLERYINDTRSKNAIPVLITPVARRKFDSTGTVIDTHLEYSELVRKVAAKNKVVLIDLDKSSMALLQQTGAENSKFFYDHIAAHENPNYPEGISDDTHFNELGARKMAELVLIEMQKQIPELSNRVYKSTRINIIR